MRAEGAWRFRKTPYPHPNPSPKGEGLSQRQTKHSFSLREKVPEADEGALEATQ
jgi:hypothetical protein